MSDRYEAAGQKLIARLGLRLLALDEIMRETMADGLRIKEIRIKAPDERTGQSMVVVKAVQDGVAAVAFHVAETPSEAITGAIDRVRNRTLKLREDLPYKG